MIRPAGSKTDARRAPLSARPQGDEAFSEFERLAQRPFSLAEKDLLEHVGRGRSGHVWAEGLRPEALALLAAAAATTGERPVVFLSPHEELLTSRSERLRPRLPAVQMISWISGQAAVPPSLVVATKRTGEDGPAGEAPADGPAPRVLVWAALPVLAQSPAVAQKFAQLMARLDRPLVFVEDAHGFGRDAFAIRPALDVVPKVLQPASSRMDAQNSQFRLPIVFGAARGQSEARRRWSLALGGTVSKRILEPSPRVILQALDPETGTPPGESVGPRAGTTPSNSGCEEPGLTPGAWSGAPRRAGQLVLGDKPAFDGQVLALLGRLPRPAVVLCGAPTDADLVYATFSAHQIPCHRFHAGMSQGQRAEELVRFALPGRKAVLVTTSGYGASTGILGHRGVIPEAFGPGYGRGDLRSIVHLSAPNSVAQLAQELTLLHTGPALVPGLSDGDPEDELDEDELPEFTEPLCGPERAGPIPQEQPPRQGARWAQQERYATLILGAADLSAARHQLERSRPDPRSIAALTDALLAGASGADHPIQSLLARADLDLRRARSALELLLDAGALSESKDGYRVNLSAAELQAVSSELCARVQRLRQLDSKRLEQVETLLESSACRQETLSRLLGEPATGACGLCDRCNPSVTDSLRHESTQSREGRRRVAPRRRGEAPFRAADSSNRGTNAAAAGESGRSLRKINPK